MNIITAYHKGWRNAGFVHEKYFSALGHDTLAFHLDETPYWSDWNHRLPFYFPKGLPSSIQDAESAWGRKADLVIEIDGAGQHHLSGMKRSSAKKILWSMDTHSEAKRRFQIYFQKDYDLVFTCHKDYTHYFKERPCEWLPVACDPDFHRDLNLPKIYDVAFVGNADPAVYPSRVDYLTRLGRKFKVGVFSKVFGEETVRIWNQTKIAFNKSFNGDLNHRVFEVMACGALLLTDRVKNGLPDLFEDGKHLVMYETYEELEEKAAFYLSHDEARLKIARAGQKETLEKHTYFRRAGAILEYAGKL